MKTLIAFIAVASTVYFVNYKYTKGVRVIAHLEQESVKEAKFQMLMMVIVIISWTAYLALF